MALYGRREYLIVETFLEDDEHFFKFFQANRANIDRDTPSTTETGAVRTTTSRAETVAPQCTTLFLRKLPRKSGAYVFGRAAESDVVLPWGSISRRHFRIAPNISAGSWFVEALSRTTVSGIELTKKGKTVTPLKYDVFNEINVSGFVFYIRPQWLHHLGPFGSAGLQGFVNLTIQSDAGTQTTTQIDPSSVSEASKTSIGSAIDEATTVDAQPNSQPSGATYHILQREAWRDAYFVQNMESGRLLAAEKISSVEKAREVLTWRKDIKV